MSQHYKSNVVTWQAIYLNIWRRAWLSRLCFLMSWLCYNLGIDFHLWLLSRLSQLQVLNIATLYPSCRDLGQNLLALSVLVENSSKCLCNFNVARLLSPCRDILGSPLTSWLIWFKSFPAPLHQLVRLHWAQVGLIGW